MPRQRSSALSWVKWGSRVEIYDSDGQWRVCKVTEIDDQESPTSILVSYIGWAQSCDEWVRDAARVRPKRDATETALDNAQNSYGSTTGAVICGGDVLWAI